MKLNFDPNQDFQLVAIKAIVDVFEGQPLNNEQLSLNNEQFEGSVLFNEFGIGNNLILGEEQILKNLHSIQNRNEIKQSEKLEGMNFSVEMETGTGKTYVYLRTIYELNKNYGYKKFVIVVPSIAIREGVLKNLEITEEHFRMLYDNVPADFYVYDSTKVSILRSFASSNAIQILVINIDSFAKDENIINKPNDKLTGKRPIEFIQNISPIVIVDEPQNMETEIRKKAIANLNPLCTLRYSATHTNYYNLVYSLDPVRAYDLGLVKQIEVDSVFTDNAFNEAYISLESVVATKTKVTAKVKIDINEKNNVVKKLMTMKVGDDLFKLSNNRNVYKDGYIIEEIDYQNQSITFSNGTTINTGETQGGMTDEIMKVQIEKTIEEHFKKEQKYKSKNIKVLSLFFIDRVANYRQYDENGNTAKGKIALWFEEIFNRISNKGNNRNLIPFSIELLHNGYFSQDKKGVLKDSSETRPTQADDDTYKLIMKDKERLLDTNEPLRFIFSHSALREGWDNPNVFQICTLNETKSEIKKRQEIGRGLRLSVNQDGNRVFDKNVNKLTVIANESYEDFAKKLQTEIEDEGYKFKREMVQDKNKRVKLEYRKGFELDPNFKDIWDRISHKTRYRVEYDTQELIKHSSEEVMKMQEIKRPEIKSVKVGLDIEQEGVSSFVIGEKKYEYSAKILDIPDIIGYIQNKTELTRTTIARILKDSKRLPEILINPQQFLDLVVRGIKYQLNEIMIDGIKYEKIAGRCYEMLLFDKDEIEIYLDKLAYAVKNENKTIYSNYIPLDSSVEYQFAQDCETREDIEFYFKLPSWFTIETPIGKYNPDWALIFKNEKKIYFVAETKSTMNPLQLREEEKLKIKCGKAHFNEFEDVEYKVVSSVGELVS
ncbi:MAG: DEAD/DEAH box helicase [Ignavibacteria bacterium RIFOXYC2_FULL_35_21]|nr:MAG: DEAD/DEAH box helicase [Ignavibacteria bacterium RIFOXYA2_FULL_35_10]OGV21263.1 MAG: DEAD/DEAH box helicase [Ignavibacteria bacterium RIFOXYC2_FULL_35_21]